MKLRTLWTPIALMALLVLSACTAGFRQPEVELEGLQVGSLGLGGGTVLVNVRIRNPNPVGFRADDLQYELFLRNSAAQGDSAWTRFAEGTFSERFNIGANDTRTVQIPVEFTFAQLGSAGQQLIRQGSFQYRAVGNVNVSTSFGGRKVPFRKTGTFTLAGGIR
ncbi:MAG: LEA type 2 family protein [Gemmatimonadetes bacterium]|nr:LEA type 2 family protein [Gemmatimonadota bacterium]